MKEINVRIKVSDSFDYATLRIFNHSIEFLYNDLRLEQSDDLDIMFKSLKNLRRDLEKFNIVLLINGSRKDAYVRGLMAFSHNVILLKLGQPMGESIKVNMFDEVNDLNLISTVDEQSAFIHTWVKSFGHNGR